MASGSVAPIPRNLTFEDTAALVFGGMTSLFYLRDKAKIQPGERALINGASGAVGKPRCNWRSIRRSGHRRLQFGQRGVVRSLGAERVVDYARDDFTQTGQTYDVILDAVGTCTFERCKHALAPGGRLLLVVASWVMLGAMLRPVASRSPGAHRS